MGVLLEEIQNKEKGIKKSDIDRGAGQDEHGDDDDDELKKVDGINPIEIGPDGIPLKRNNSDVMNNFFIMHAVRCFTDIEILIKKKNTQNTRVF
jgi:hypothetical protein